MGQTNGPKQAPASPLNCAEPKQEPERLPRSSNWKIMSEIVVGETLLRALLESSEDAVVEVSLEGRIIRWNRGAEKLYGYPEDEMREQTLVQLVPIYEVPVIEALLADLRKGALRRSETSERLRKDGSCVCVAVRRT